MVLAVIAVAHFAQADDARHILQLAIAIGRAGQAIERMVGDIELHHAAAQLGERRRLGVHLDAGRDRRVARGGRALAAFDLDEAHAARAERLLAIGGAELGHLDAGLVGRAHDRGALGHRDLEAVDLARHALLGLTAGVP